MEDITGFIQSNMLLVGGLLIILFLIVKVEIGRLTRKYNQINVNEAIQLMNNDDTVIVDVREDKEVTNGMIQGARHIKLGNLPARMGELNNAKTKPVLVYCRSGNRSSHACHQLTKEGFEDVYNLAGGITAWESANLPVSKR
jgi:rhodanese-related sulfurtransferase